MSIYKEERQKVTQAILKLYNFPIGMEMFHADNEELWIQIKNTIDMTDYYVNYRKMLWNIDRKRKNKLY